MSDEITHTILLVDDEERILKALKRLLSVLNVNIITAAGGAEALDLMARQQVSLIVSDEKMPGMTGVELLRRSRDLAPEAVRILLTGFADIKAAADAINSGAIRYYFNKPWDDEALVSRIKESLDLFTAKAENWRLQELTARQNLQLKELNENLQQKVEAQVGEIQTQHEELKQSFMETIRTMSTVIELRFSEVGSHSQRVSSMVKKMLTGHGLRAKEYQDIIVAAHLHDIGKISLPDRLLSKSIDQYTPPEREQLFKHPILGQSCVYNVSGFEEIGVIIRHHHESFDGTGYPDGLAADKIPFGARVIRICDAFDHNAFKSGYPDLKTINLASAKLVQSSGTDYDPDLVRKFIDGDVGRQLYHDDSSDTVNVRPGDLKEGMVIDTDINTKNGMFLLPKGAKLSVGMISRINKIHAVDPILGTIRVYRQNATKRKQYVSA